MNENRRILGATLSTSLVHHFVEIHLSHSCICVSTAELVFMRVYV